MSKDVKDKILEDIKKSGFLSEMQTTSLLLKNGWNNISNAKTYLDKDQGKSREIDIIGYKVKYNDSELKSLRVGIHIIIEVKKSEKPWVVFCQEKKPRLYFGLGWGIINLRGNITSKELSYGEINSENRHFNSEIFGTSYYEAFKDPSNKSQIYSSLISSCKAAVHQKEMNQKAYVEKSNGYEVDFFLPIVVLDGVLFNSTLNESGDPILSETSYSPIQLNYSSNNYDHSFFFPEIVTLKGFCDHLKAIEKWHQNIFDSINNKMQD